MKGIRLGGYDLQSLAAHQLINKPKGQPVKKGCRAHKGYSKTIEEYRECIRCHEVKRTKTNFYMSGSSYRNICKVCYHPKE